MKPKLVIFDVDGLMLDTEKRWQKAWQEVGLKYGIEDLGGSIFLKCVGRTGNEVETIISQELKDHNDPIKILNEARSYGKKLLDEKIDVKPGIFELLRFLEDKSIRKAVATSTSRNLTIERLTRLNLIEHFDYILSGDEVEKRKPNPEIYLKVMNHFDVDSKDVLILEDSKVGVEAAYRAGGSCIMVPDLVQPDQLQIDQTYAIVSSLFEVREYIDEN